MLRLGTGSGRCLAVESARGTGCCALLGPVWAEKGQRNTSIARSPEVRLQAATAAQPPINQFSHPDRSIRLHCRRRRRACNWWSRVPTDRRRGKRDRHSVISRVSKKSDMACTPTRPHHAVLGGSVRSRARGLDVRPPLTATSTTDNPGPRPKRTGVSGAKGGGGWPSRWGVVRAEEQKTIRHFHFSLTCP